MKNIFIIAICCLCLCGCENKDKLTIYETKCETPAKQMLEEGKWLKSTIIHNKVDFTSYSEYNTYFLDSISEAIDANDYLNEECDKNKGDFLDCSVERTDSYVSVKIDTKCNDNINCSYENAIKYFEEQGMECNEDIKK